MKNSKTEYEQIVSGRKEIAEQINVLEEGETVKKYIELCSQDDKLDDRQTEMYKQIKVEEFSSCSHIWVTILREYNGYEGRLYDYCGCIKCGLDRRLYPSEVMERRYELGWVTLDQEIIYKFLKDNDTYEKGYGCVYKEKGRYLPILCDFDLAKAIYSKIKEEHPDIDDETATKYFEVALHNIRNTKVSDERKENRAKRLSLSPKFNKWTGRDVKKGY